jgi:hypothetical protein
MSFSVIQSSKPSELNNPTFPGYCENTVFRTQRN